MSSNAVSGARIAVVQFDPKFCASTHAPRRVSPFQLWKAKTYAPRVGSVGQVDANIKKAKGLCAG